MGKRILIVEDSASMRQLMCYTLEDAGYEVIVATDGIEGLLKASEPGIDVIVTDINMPRMGGLEFVRKLRGGGGNKFTPVLILTKEFGRSDAAREAGASGIMLKPFSPEQLVGAIRRLVGQA